MAVSEIAIVLLHLAINIVSKYMLHGLMRSIGIILILVLCPSLVHAVWDSLASIGCW